MDYNTGKPNHIEDYLCTVRLGQWFGWTDSNNKIYANLKVLDGGSKPTEKQCTDGLAALQAAWNLENNSYKSQRRAEYPSIEEQLDNIYHNGVDAWKATIKTIKDKYPKPS
jgi:outer membrane PBP1 activator LpoA protein|tara:strand:+ start:628 stop:960 length:333 start_codon:yes stop_codon:yes gene_type:complete